MGLHIVGHLEIAKLLLADSRVDVDAANVRLIERSLEAVQSLLRPLER